MTRSVSRAGGKWLLAACGALTLAAVVAWWAWRPAPSPEVSRLARPASRLDGYVGSDACVACHRGISERYREHPMGQSLAPALEARVVEDYERTVQFTSAGSRRYEVERGEQGVFHHEVGLDHQGRALYDQRVKIEYALGSGRRGRSYVLNRDGYLFLSPISWYSQEAKWDLSPDYEPDRHPRFDREASDRCLQCHAGRLHYAEAPGSEAAQRYLEPPFAEYAIGCERCHGPGRDHVAFHQGIEPDGSEPDGSRRDRPERRGPDPIVNPAELEPARRDAVCLQCHLQGEHQILRYGRSHADFRPGDRLGDIWSVFVRPIVAVETGSGKERAAPAVSQVEQMHASRCYLASEGRLGCTSCHDPHSVPSAGERVSYFRTRCLSCHQTEACRGPRDARREEADSCIACHMPKLSADDVPHTTQTDHRIPRSHVAIPVPISGRDAEPSVPEELLIFDQEGCPLSDLERQRARGLMLIEKAEWESRPELAGDALPLLIQSAAAAPDDLDVLDGLALAHMLRGDASRAVATWKRVLERFPDQKDALYSLAVHFHNRGDSRQAAEYLERFVERYPWDAEMLGRYSHVLSESGKLDEAILTAEESLRRNPSLSRTYAWLAELYQRQGDHRQSDHYRRLWLRVQ